MNHRCDCHNYFGGGSASGRKNETRVNGTPQKHDFQKSKKAWKRSVFKPYSNGATVSIVEPKASAISSGFTVSAPSL